MGGDDALRYDGPVLRNDAIARDLTAAAEDGRLTKPSRKLASSLLAAAPVLPLDGVRAVYRAIARDLPPGTAPSLAAALAAKPAPRAATSPPPPPDPATAARHQALRDAADQASYDAMVAAATAGERAAVARRGTRVADFRQQLALGAHVSVATGTGFAAGWVAGGAVWRGDATKRLIGGIIGLTAALLVEVLLIVLHTRPGRDGDGSSRQRRDRPTPAPAHHPDQAVLDAEAEVAALVVAGAAREARQQGGGEGGGGGGLSGDKKND